VQEELCERIQKYLESPVDVGPKAPVKGAKKEKVKPEDAGEASGAAGEDDGDAAPEADGQDGTVKKRKGGRPAKAKAAEGEAEDGEKKTRKRKTKEEKALHKPRGRSAFILFRMDKQKQVSAEHPEAKSAPQVRFGLPILVCCSCRLLFC
jgi:hypothetical protein